MAHLPGSFHSLYSTSIQGGHEAHGSIKVAQLQEFLWRSLVCPKNLIPAIHIDLSNNLQRVLKFSVVKMQVAIQALTSLNRSDILITSLLDNIQG